MRRVVLTAVFVLLSAPVLAQIGSGASLPAGACNDSGGSLYYLTAGETGLYVCAAGVWTKTSSGGGAAWGEITGTLGDQTDLQTELDAKQATLVSGTSIKTVNGTSLLGSGDLETGGGSGVPAGMITFLTSGTCPEGWEEATELDGKTIIGTLAANKDVGTTGGSDTITDVLDHTHAVTVTDPGHVHVENTNSATTGGLRGSTPDTSTNTSVASGYSTASNTTGITATTNNPAGGVASLDNRSAFLFVIACRKT